MHVQTSRYLILLAWRHVHALLGGWGSSVIYSSSNVYCQWTRSKALTVTSAGLCAAQGQGCQIGRLRPNFRNVASIEVGWPKKFWLALWPFLTSSQVGWP